MEVAAELSKGLAAVALPPGIIATRMLRSNFGNAAGRQAGGFGLQDMAGKVGESRLKE